MELFVLADRKKVVSSVAGIEKESEDKMMYEYYNYENQVIPDGREQQEAELKAKALQEKQREKKARRKRWMSCISYGLVFGIVAGCAFQGVNLIGNKLQSNQAETTTEQPAEEKEEAAPATAVSATEEAAPVTMAVADVASGAMPSIVSITNKSVQEVQMMFGMGTQEYESESLGSGIIVGKNDTELLIVTNNHVIEGANTLSVSFIDNEVYEATLKGADSENDLAVIAVKLADVKESTLGQIEVAVLGDSSELVIGEPVVAIGNALGYGQSVTTGIVSALDREINMDNLSSKLIQTDAAINPGNSGGALLNMKGEVIGINSAKFASSQVEGMGYSIPISTAMPIIEDLMSRETRELVDESDASYLGITGLSVTSQVSETYGIPEGIYISEVYTDTPAQAAGLQKGDVVKKFDGISVTSITELQERLQYYKAGETVEMLIERADNGEYKEMTLTVTLGSRADANLEESDQSSSEDSSQEGPQENQSDSSSGQQTYPSYDGQQNLFDFFGY
ncbi:MAG: trypsin-like peptidase domain-containing protein [Lachnospiraceae bacterium]